MVDTAQSCRRQRNRALAKPPPGLRPTAGPPSLLGRPGRHRRRAIGKPLVGHGGSCRGLHGSESDDDVCLSLRTESSVIGGPTSLVNGDRGRYWSQPTGSLGGSTGRRASSWWIVAPSGEEKSRRRRIGSPDAARKTEGWGTSSRRDRYDRCPDVGPARWVAAVVATGACGERKSACRSLIRAVFGGVQRHRESGATFRRR